MKYLLKLIRYLIGYLTSKLHNIPFKIKNHWDYSHTPLKEQMSKMGIEIGKVPYNSQVGDLVCLMQNKEFEFIYVVTRRIRLKGSDFYYGTDTEFDLQLYEAINNRGNKK